MNTKELVVKRTSIIKVIESKDKFAFYMLTMFNKNTFTGILCHEYTDELFNSSPYRNFDIVVQMGNKKFILDMQTINTIGYDKIVAVEVDFTPYAQYIKLMHALNDTMLGIVSYNIFGNSMIYKDSFRYHKNIRVEKTVEPEENSVSIVKKQNDEFMASIDKEAIISEFVANRCITGINCKIQMVALYSEYAKWCSDNDKIFVDSITFHNYFAKKFCIMKDTNEFILGVDLHKNTEPIGEIQVSEGNDCYPIAMEFELSEENRDLVSIPKTNIYHGTTCPRKHDMDRVDTKNSIELTEENIEYIKTHSIQDVSVKFNISYSYSSKLRSTFNNNQFRNDYEAFLGEYSEDDINTISNMETEDIAELFSLNLKDAYDLKLFCKRKFHTKGKYIKLELSDEDIEFISQSSIKAIEEKFNCSNMKARALRNKYRTIGFYYKYSDHFKNTSNIPIYIIKAAKANDEFFRKFEEETREYFRMINPRKMHISKENFIKEYPNIPDNYVDDIYVNIQNRRLEFMDPSIVKNLMDGLESKNANTLALVCKKFIISPIDMYMKYNNNRQNLRRKLI